MSGCVPAEHGVDGEIGPVVRSGRKQLELEPNPRSAHQGVPEAICFYSINLFARLVAFGYRKSGQDSFDQLVDSTQLAVRNSYSPLANIPVNNGSTPVPFLVLVSPVGSTGCCACMARTGLTGYYKEITTSNEKQWRWWPL